MGHQRDILVVGWGSGSSGLLTRSVAPARPTREGWGRHAHSKGCGSSATSVNRKGARLCP